MKESELEVEAFDRIDVSRKNRNRLILQNKKLLTEVFKLEQIISTVIEKNLTDEFVNIEESEQLHEKYRKEQEEQLRTITRLKKEIKSIKASFAEHKYDQIRDEQNQVTYLRRELDKLVSERDTLTRKKHQKEEQLQYYKPINNQTASTRELYMKTKAKNNELKYKIHEVEREVGKYHNIKQLAKSSVPKEYENPDYHYIKFQNEMNGMKKEMRKIEEKWKVKIEALDREYFGFKDLKKFKISQIETLEKQIKNYENRIASMRDEITMASDRERVSGIIISPQKRKEMHELLDDEKKKLKRLSPKGDKSKIEKGNKNVDKAKMTKIENVMKLIPQAKEQTKSEKLPQSSAQYAATQYSQKKEQKQSQEKLPAKSNKIVESVGVGTSFYYADD